MRFLFVDRVLELERNSHIVAVRQITLADDLCSPDCIDTTGSHLGVLCSDPYSSFLNGQQSNLGPKFEVDAATGFHPHPVTDIGNTGNAIFKRLQVHNDDLDPDLNESALYFVEGQYVTADDAAADNQNNNASYRKVLVSGSNGFFNIQFDGPTQQQLPAIRAWSIHDTDVDEIDVQIPGDGLFILASKVTDLGDGSWHYEYALHNLNSHRSARAFRVPIPAGATVTDVGFHDVSYHSGEPYDDTDWNVVLGGSDEIEWSTRSFVDNPDGNALRWGTLYNFRFDADVPPAFHDVSIGLFRPGVPDSWYVTTWTPSMCNADGTCDPSETCANCAVDCANGVCDPGEDACNCQPDCGDPLPELSCDDQADNDCDQFYDCFDTDCCADVACAPPDADGDHFVGCEDCVEGDEAIWGTPSDVLNLRVAKLGTVAQLTWDEPAAPGASRPEYELIRTPNPQDFVDSAVCLSGFDPTARQYNDALVPQGLLAYLVRAINDCPDGAGEGSVGTDSDGAARIVRDCP